LRAYDPLARGVEQTPRKGNGMARENEQQGGGGSRKQQKKGGGSRQDR